MTGRYSRSLEAEQYRHLYRTALWRKIRLQHLASEPLCRMCRAEGRITAALICDHITPHKGDESLFFSGPFQSLCKPCHDRHKQSEERTGRAKPVIGLDGWPVEQDTTVHLGAISHPAWLRPLKVPLTIVCGPPASGKTTYVTTHKGNGDIVLDLDMIAVKHYGKGAALLTSEQRLECLKERNEALRSLMGNRPHCSKAWLILTEPDARKRQWWADTLHPAEVIVMETPADQCIARAQADTRQRRPDNVAASIADWWATYRRREGDIIISA